jgi:rare lipoprotein A
LRRFVIFCAVVWSLFAVAGALGIKAARAEQATWYGYENGPATASGERFNPEGGCADYPQHSCTCAHRHFSFGTLLLVTRHGRSVVCRVTDRGPARWTGADLDLSLSGARVLRMVEAGRARVSIERIGRLE